MLELQNIIKTYHVWLEEIQVLKSISLSVPSGSFVAIMWPSWSGKSTLMNIIGLLDVPTSGNYILNGTPLEKMSGDQQSRFRGQTVGFIFQWYNLISRMNALNQVMLPLSYQGIGLSERRKKATEALRKVWLGDKLESKPNELSWWQQQRVAIARAIVSNPAIILADEPTGALDSKTWKEVMEILQWLHKEGKTIILITHDSSIAAFAERIVRIKDGILE